MKIRRASADEKCVPPAFCPAASLNACVSNIPELVSPHQLQQRYSQPPCPELLQPRLSLSTRLRRACAQTFHCHAETLSTQPHTSRHLSSLDPSIAASPAQPECARSPCQDPPS